MRVDLANLGFAEGGNLLVKRALRYVPAGGEILVHGTSPELALHLETWCRAEGHKFRWIADSGEAGHTAITRGESQGARWARSERAGNADPSQAGAVTEHPPQTWGLAARGATVEAGAPVFDFRLVHKAEVWTDDAARIYEQAVAAQWNPETAIPWSAEFQIPDEIEDAVVRPSGPRLSLDAVHRHAEAVRGSRPAEDHIGCRCVRWRSRTQREHGYAEHETGSPPNHRHRR